MPRLAPPLRLRRIAADMKLKDVTSAEIAAATGIHHVTISRVLRGRENNADVEKRIAAFIAAAPTPASL